eukprot:Phypoly_transcript_01947.p1 GENE.Phypoly_transcript_01947~~Phypoly_transcript_01947.p1  ORF type:complete len:919 (+),score=98.36 Phypoly_transcript_01947:138-2894(+)
MVTIKTKVPYHQGHLANVVHEIFRHEHIKVNTRKETNIKSPKGRSIEWDIWIPELNLSIEYQDDYHYITKWYAHRSLASVAKGDSFKLAKTRVRGTTLIFVPCWWDGTKESLAATIGFHRPDLLGVDVLEPIPENPPFKYFEAEEVPDVGELMLASFPTTRAQQKSISADHLFWWMGEKYDGIRCCWNPGAPALFTRTGTFLDIPSTFSENFPKAFLDGEIWFGRGFFLESQKIIHKDISESVDVNYMRIVVFDNPSPHDHENLRPFEMRYAVLFSWIPANHPFMVIATRTLCENYDRLSSSLVSLLDSGSEGVILRRPGSEYVHGRSPWLLKLKATRADREALVVSCKSNCYVLKLPEGIIFEVPSENNASSGAPRPGDVVTISYDSYTRNAVPMNPTISQIRKDVNWELILRDFVRSDSPDLEGDFYTPTPTKPHSFWVAEKGKNMRKFMENFAKGLNFDPLATENWYSLIPSQFKELSRILSHFKGSYATALKELFPEVKFERSKFILLPRNHWGHVNTRREFFDTFARQNGFDPLNPENWYEVDTAAIFATKNGRGALGGYNHSLISALMHVYPNIGLVKSKFFIGDTQWAEESERRQFFVDLAARRGFDPLVAENWYAITAEQVRREKTGGQLLMRHKGSLGKALIELFPEVKFDRSKFQAIHTFWVGTGNYRSYFTRFAKLNKFDPLVADNWYSITHRAIRKFKETMESNAAARQISMAQFIPLLVESFPELRLSTNKFRYTSSAKFWADPQNRRDVFIEFAKARDMDPFHPDTWYSFKLKDIEGSKKISTILHYHKGVVPALLDLFPDIGLDARKFHKFPPSKFWADMRNRKEYLMQFARANLFDPLVPENWYRCNLDKLWAYKGSQHLLRCYSGNFIRAIMSIFPDIGLEKAGFMREQASQNYRSSTYRL